MRGTKKTKNSDIIDDIRDSAVRQPRRLTLNDFTAAAKYAEKNPSDPFARDRALTALALNYVLASELDATNPSLV